jgi:hypothetical protein
MFLRSLLDFFDSKGADSKLLQNVRHYLPIDMVYCRRRIESSTPPAWESQIFHDADRSGEATCMCPTVTRDQKVVGKD